MNMNDAESDEAAEIVTRGRHVANRGNKNGGGE